MDAYHISAKEILPVVIAAAIWGEGWSASRCSSSRITQLWWLSSTLVPAGTNPYAPYAMSHVHHGKMVSASHVRGIHNSLADALSRNNRDYFLSHYPQAQPSPSSIPLTLVGMLITSKPDWTSPHWTSLWNTFFKPH